MKNNLDIKGDIKLTKSEIIERINKIFLNNSSFSKVENDYLITQQKIIDILKKSKIIEKKLIKINEVDVMLSQINPKKKYNLKDFINFITKLCEKIYKKDFQKDKKGIMNYFLNCFFNNYEEYLDENSSQNFIETTNNNSTTIKSIETIITTKIEIHVAELLCNLYYSLKKIYDFYFKEELNIKTDNEKLKQISLNNLIIFSKDFEIIPYLISESKIVTYYNFVLKYNLENPEIQDEILLNLSNNENEDLSVSEIRKKNPLKDFGKCYKFTMFMYFIYHFSLITYYKQIQLNFIKKNIKPNEIDILIYFLQRLENSNGLSIYIKKKGSTINSKKLTFLPSENYIEEIRKKIEEENKKLEEIENQNLKNIVNNNTINNLSNTLITNNNNSISNNNMNNEKEKEKGNIICKIGIRENILIDNKMIKQFNSLSIYKNKNYNLKEVLNLNNEIISLIEENIEGLSELFLKFSKLNDKLSFNRMSLSAYIKFLKYANIIVKIPDEMKKQYLKMGEQIMKKNFNISEIKRFDIKNGSKTCAPLILNEAEKDYKKKIAQIVNANKKSFDKLSESDASIVFFSLTGTKNFNNKNLKNQFDKNSGFNFQFGNNNFNTSSFDKKNDLQNQLNIPSKLDFLLFIKSFEVISAKLYPNKTLNEAFLELFLNKIKPIIPKQFIINSNDVQINLKKINNEKIKNFLVKFSPVIQSLYSYYCDELFNMRFNQFFDFYRDFNLFPDLINLNKLKTIFFTLCESNKKIEKNEKEIKENYNEENESENNEINNIENCNNIEENNNSFIEEKKSEIENNNKSNYHNNSFLNEANYNKSKLNDNKSNNYNKSYLNEDNNKSNLNDENKNEIKTEINDKKTEINESKTELNKNTINLNEKNDVENYSKDQIDFTLFLESLAISAMFFNYKNMLNDMDRMLFLAERIYQSKPINEVIMKNEINNNTNKLFEEFLKNIREEYNKNIDNNPKTKFVEFDKIFDDENPEYKISKL